jgi:alpha-glucosidase
MSQTGWPINQSLALHWGSDSRCYDSRYQEEFLFGPSLLVAPCKSTQRLSEIWLPEHHGQDAWYRLWDDQPFTPGEHLVEAPLHALPVFVKAGSLIPEHESFHYRNHADFSDTLSLHLYWGGTSVSQYVLHSDNDSLSVKTAHLTCRFDPGTGEFSLQTSGDWSLPYSHIRLLIHGNSKALSLGMSKNKSSALHSSDSNDFALQENLYMERVNRQNASPIQSIVLPVSSNRYWVR